MTVSSLWKVLDEADCGTPVGAAEMLDPEAAPKSRNHHLQGVNPWNVNEHQKTMQAASNATKTTCLAVDLSIWICESLTSHAMKENHVNPALHLVFSRTCKLLSSGIKLIFVVEGKRRVRHGADDKLQKRRSGTAFWKACKDCKTMLETMGVTVVQAKAEGEALCALLNQRGIVDGVISNDGDCLVFGAKVLYTRFSIENLENSQVIRYSADKLQAKIRATDAEDVAKEEIGTVALSRSDLISFALLTGSDLVGPGLTNVGYFKAIRFIRKCQLDNPLRQETAALDELQSWENVAKESTVGQHDNEICVGLQELKEKVGQCCSRCCHKGNKRSHEKHGCEECGTQPGEPCFLVTADDKFRKALRDKALEARPPFEPRYAASAYSRPNENQIPAKLGGATSTSIPLEAPNLNKLLDMNLIVKGRSFEASREYLKTSMGRLLSRLDLLRLSHDSKSNMGQMPSTFRFSSSRPEPLRIVKAVTRNQVPSYEVEWKVNATVTDEDGEGIDGYEYSTFEPRKLIANGYPQLVQDFEQAEKEKHRQGDGEKERRREFLRSLCIDVNAPTSPKEENGDDSKSPSGGQKKRKKAFFRNRQRIRPRTFAMRNRRRQNRGGQDAGLLRRFIGRQGSDQSPRVARDTVNPYKLSMLDRAANEEGCENKNESHQDVENNVNRDPNIPKSITIPFSVNLARSPSKLRIPFWSPKKKHPRVDPKNSPRALPTSTMPNLDQEPETSSPPKAKRRLYSPKKNHSRRDAPRASKPMSPILDRGPEISPPKVKRRFYSPKKAQQHEDAPRASKPMSPILDRGPDFSRPKVRFYSPPKMQLRFTFGRASPKPTSPNRHRRRWDKSDRRRRQDEALPYRPEAKPSIGSPAKMEYDLGSPISFPEASRPNLDRGRRNTLYSDEMLFGFGSPNASPEPASPEIDFSKSDKPYEEKATFCDMGGYLVEMSPIRPRRGALNFY